MSDPQAPDDPYAPRPQQGGEPQAAPPGPGSAPAPGAGYDDGRAAGYGYAPQPPYAGAAPGAGYGYGSPPSPGYGPPTYPMPGPYGAAQAPYGSYGPAYPKNSLGVWALVLGLASFALACGFVTGIPAIVVGRQGQRAVDEGLADNRGLSTAGLVLGWVAVGLSLLFAVVLLVGGGIALLGRGTR